MNRLRRVVLGGPAALALVLGISGCGGGESEPTRPASPGTGTSANAAGAALFKQYCAVCHGETGKGDGAGAAGLAVKPRDLTTEPYKFVDIAAAGSELEALVSYIKKGRIESGMPAWEGVLKDAQLHDVAAYVESVRPKPNFVEEQPTPEGETPPAEQDAPGGG